MSEELQQVDDSVLNSLNDLRRERDALRQRLARMQEAASDVSEKVLARVRSDYEARIAALEEKASPLKEAAHGEHDRLMPVLDKAREECETLRLDKEEIELRHKLGEFDEDEHRAKAAQVGESLSAAEDRVAAISDVVARLRGAFEAPGELAAASTPPVGIPAPPGTETPATALAAGGAQSGEPHEEEGTLIVPPEPPPAPEPPPLPALALEPPVWAPSAAWAASSSTAAAPEEPWRAAAAAPLSAPDEPETRLAPMPPLAPMAPEDPPEPEVPTTGLETYPAARARLEALDGDLEPLPHYLEPLTFIGRTPENQIRIYKPAVSRRHAQITETDAGWLLRDLSSENGTYVNGQRITERLLAEGDRVQFGTSRFVLRIAT